MRNKNILSQCILTTSKNSECTDCIPSVHFKAIKSCSTIQNVLSTQYVQCPVGTMPVPGYYRGDHLLPFYQEKLALYT